MKIGSRDFFSITNSKRNTNQSCCDREPGSRQSAYSQDYKGSAGLGEDVRRENCIIMPVRVLINEAIMGPRTEISQLQV